MFFHSDKFDVMLQLNRKITYDSLLQDRNLNLQRNKLRFIQLCQVNDSQFDISKKLFVLQKFIYGYLVDYAFSLNWNPELDPIVQASKEATNEAVKLLQLMWQTDTKSLWQIDYFTQR
ncbi:Methionine_aminopeptidase [Hexamita inflata]|uniref:Methionine aminopeptidase n=1 Tax=Hexamita inflata TaxID=28002 RepID=A0AA86RFC7_9EUKA|nr:Methionine aminopeptidase [Hexamita inflata]